MTENKKLRIGVDLLQAHDLDSLDILREQLKDITDEFRGVDKVVAAACFDNLTSQMWKVFAEYEREKRKAMLPQHASATKEINELKRDLAKVKEELGKEEERYKRASKIGEAYGCWLVLTTIVIFVLGVGLLGRLG